MLFSDWSSKLVPSDLAWLCPVKHHKSSITLVPAAERNRKVSYGHLEKEACPKGYSALPSELGKHGRDAINLARERGKFLMKLLFILALQLAWPTYGLSLLAWITERKSTRLNSSH